MSDNPSAQPLTGPGGIWEAMSSSGGIIPVFAQFRHRASGLELPVSVRFSKEQTHSHLENELARFTLTGSEVSCQIGRGLPEVYCGRIQALMPYMLAYLEGAELEGYFDVSLGDEGLNTRVLSFCSIIPDFLVPDPYYVHSAGYAAERDSYARGPAWDKRQDTLYWRGTDTGVWRYTNVEHAPRVAICNLARRNPETINAAITRVELRPGHEEKRAYYEQKGYFGVEEDQSAILDYRYQLDIDGNTSTWSSFFLKLLTGSPVLKVDSECGWKQWYYDRLLPGEHFVTVRADLADLEEKLDWLRADHEAARKIGNAGRQFALSMTFSSEMAAAVSTIDRLVTLNRRVRFE